MKKKMPMKPERRMASEKDDAGPRKMTAKQMKYFGKKKK